MCAPEFNFIKVPTPIIINGIAFDEEDFDPIDFEFDDDFEFDEAASDIIPLFISDTESYESLSDLTHYSESDSEDLDQDSSSDEIYPAVVAFQERLYSFLLVNHSVLRTYDSGMALNYSTWIFENRSNFPSDLDDFIDIQLGIILDIIIQSYTLPV
jgi:hypothetical protein